MGRAARANPRAQAVKRGELKAVERPKKDRWPEGVVQREERRSMFSRFVNFALRRR